MEEIGKISGCGISLDISQCTTTCDKPCINVCFTDALVQKQSGAEEVTLSESRCFSCGLCVKLQAPERPYICDALRPYSHIERIQKWRNNGIPFGILIGPGLEYYRNQINLSQVSTACRELGAQKVYRTIAAAAQALTAIVCEVENRWKYGERLIIDSRCGAIRNFVRKLRPDLVGSLVRSNSTLFTSAELARQQLPKQTCLAFVGPDVAYKETIDHPSEGGLVNAILTWHEFIILCATSLGESIDKLSKGHFDDHPFQLRKGFVPSASDFKRRLQTCGIPYLSLIGKRPREIVLFLRKLKTNQFYGFLEVLFCGSCVHGPGVYPEWLHEQAAKDTKKLITQSVEVTILGEDTMRHFNRLKGDLEKFAADHPFDKTVFVMMKFPDKPGERVKDKVLNRIFECIQKNLLQYGLIAVRADGKNYATSGELWDNICIYMLGCKYGVAVLESKYKDEFNPNVALEYGFMMALGRGVVLLEEEDFHHRRADIFGKISRSFHWTKDITKLDESIARAIEQWMIDLGKTKISSH